MTTKQIAKLTALRAEADAHGDSRTVAMADAALAGDRDAATKLGLTLKAAKAASTGASSRAPIRQRGWGAVTPVHPWSHDEE